MLEFCWTTSPMLSKSSIVTWRVSLLTLVETQAKLRPTSGGVNNVAAVATVLHATTPTAIANALEAVFTGSLLSFFS